ncbi:MAG: M28 family peptidase [candidate division KSB1 bacterium]|nr:M28 family peptidase [candidate division KSB1 bacterium]MDZ7274865.1 M28 family peptidase [candidate division KSB1 bacterium]MDZ7286683.1 M28 family peptidase [candidate division KSB1 bacterium]MDZ7299154.1 M28 family peptidase [candidate division KSB1 bacterium]MDZ7307036.1 M28 family peptidase [candidate division KSB1 bacterium]
MVAPLEMHALVPVTTLRTFLTAALLCLLPAAPARTNNGHPAEQAFVRLVSADSARRYVRELVAYGPRQGGTSSNRAAAEYVQQKFRAWGLASTLITDPGKLVYEAQHWELAQVFPEAKSFLRPWPYGFSPAAAAQEAEVTMASGAAALRGKVVLTDKLVSRRQYEAYAGAGAVALLSDAPGREGDFTAWAMIGTLPERRDNPIPVFAISRSDGNRLRALLAQGVIPRVAFALQSKIFHGRPQTVIATLAGAVPEKHFIYCAHGDSDSGGPGADDNASGVAVVMETARVLQSLITEKKLPPPRHTIAFIIWGSEYFSTRAYLAQRSHQLERILGVINFDQTGTGTRQQAIYFEGNDIPWNEALLRTLDRIGGEYCGRPGFWQAYTTNPSQGGTDAYVFLPPQFHGTLQAPQHIPAVTIFTAAWDQPARPEQTPGWHSSCWPAQTPLEIDYSRYYHSSGDIPEWTTDREPWRMAWAARAGGLALLRLLW